LLEIPGRLLGLKRFDRIVLEGEGGVGAGGKVTVSALR